MSKTEWKLAEKNLMCKDLSKNEYYQMVFFGIEWEFYCWAELHCGWQNLQSESVTF